jgi:hypothetical protein
VLGRPAVLDEERGPAGGDRQRGHEVPVGLAGAEHEPAAVQVEQHAVAVVGAAAGDPRAAHAILVDRANLGAARDRGPADRVEHLANHLQRGVAGDPQQVADGPHTGHHQLRQSPTLHAGRGRHRAGSRHRGATSSPSPMSRVTFDCKSSTFRNGHPKVVNTIAFRHRLAVTVEV